jgi:hypothetical protein
LQGLKQDGLEQLHPILVAVGRKSSDHLIDNAAKAPPVDCFGVPLLADHLRSEVLRSSTNGHGFFVFIDKGLGKSKVGKFDVASFVKEDVFWFKTGLRRRYSR